MEDVITIGDLEIWPEDFPKKMTWHEANTEIAKLGSGWRVPTLDEFKRILYPNRSKLPNAKTSKWQLADYWSSTQYDSNNMFCFNFGETYTPAYNKTKSYYMLAVRDRPIERIVANLLKEF